MSGKASSYNLSLIAAYRKHNLLYDNRHRDYKVQNPTKEAWSNVSTVCNSTPDECRSRWKALRDRFIKERKKKNSNSNYKVAWPLYNKMSFLEPFIENTFSRNKKDIRSGFSRLASSLGVNGDVSRKTIDNVVQLLVREAQSSNTMVPRTTIIPDVDMPLVLPSKRSENGEHTTSDDPNELEQFYLKLIREVKKHQLLYDSSSSLYRVASARNRVWDEIAENFESFGEGYSSSELRTKWRSIRDRYIRERRLYKESIQEGNAKFPKWALYPEFAFLDFYVDQSMPRTYQNMENNNDTESVHSEDNRENDNGNDGNDFNMINESPEADQSSQSSSSSTPSTSTGPSQPNVSVLQLLQRIMQNAENQQRWPSADNSNLSNIFNQQPNNNSALDLNSTIMKNLSVLMQNPNFRFRNGHIQNNISSVGDGITEVIGELKTCLTKLTNLSNDLNENGLEYSFGKYVAAELIKTPEPKRSELRRSIMSLLNESKLRTASPNVSSS
ncbi:hypothetical protein M3Y97_00805800 [Aphelenchoides bicaudatus]|nr:hypothetical protein M3Y97_00805800 [Aphelenchoides bicaudatus]